ncbi:hypothetical protein EZV62_024094 [Acer yangbiense]|uniref:Uncharacterized protein n=1 Tax=Acer yangbiense TaxID=1000413 RepID=A0A5C7H3J4_9ROSI|nr:hypothetical protein EZV62_024094 [Acer yangbiense]
MDLVNGFKVFFLTIFTKLSTPLPVADPLPPPLQPVVANNYQHNLDWAMIMIGFCLPSAVEIALQSLQAHESHLPLSLHFLSLAIILSFTFLFLGKFMPPKFIEIAKVLERFGVLLAVTAIYIAITIPMPIWFKYITWTVFIVSRN